MVDFITPMFNKDINACRHLISQLKKRSNPALSWEQPLISLSEAINLYFNEAVLVAILRELPAEITVALYCRLTASIAPASFCINTLIDHIFKIYLSDQEHAARLIKILLTSQWAIKDNPRLQELILMLEPLQQRTILLQIQAQAEKYLFKPQSCYEIRCPIYNENYQSLLSFLTMNTTKELPLLLANEQPHPQLLKQFLPEKAFTVLQNQSIIYKQLQTLSLFFIPFNNGREVIDSLARAGRWQLRLPLIYGGLFPILHYYKTASTGIKQKIECTKLYRHCLTQLSASKTIQQLNLDNLYGYLRNYQLEMAGIDAETLLKVQSTLAAYQTTFTMIKNHSPPCLALHLQADSMVTPQQISTQADMDVDKLGSDGLTIEKHLKQIVKEALNNPQIIQLMKQEDILNWIFHNIIYPPIAEQLDETTLELFLSNIPPSQLARHIEMLVKTQEMHRDSLKLLVPISSPASIRQLLEQLLKLSLKELKQVIRTSELLHLEQLEHILRFAFHSKADLLSSEQINALLLTGQQSNQQDIEWVSLDLALLEERIVCVSNRLEQLIHLGLGYHDDQQNEGRLDIILHLESVKSYPFAVIRCLDSYYSCFAKYNSDQEKFINILAYFLTHSPFNQKIIQQLNKNLIEKTIILMVKQASRYSNALEQLINSEYKEYCQEQLHHGLLKCISPVRTPINIAQLSAQQLEEMPKTSRENILAIQRLLFFAKPCFELVSFAEFNDNPSTHSQRQFFCADASMYRLLNNISQKSSHNVNHCLLWLLQNNQEQTNYGVTLELFLAGKEIKHPIAYFHWLCWKSFLVKQLTQDSNYIIDGFFSWLERLNENQLKNELDLSRILEHIIELQLMTSILDQAILRKNKLKKHHIAWLCENTLKTKPQNEPLIPSITKLSSWGWLENYMQTSSFMTYALVADAIANSDRIAEINISEQTQEEFIARLKNSKFLPQQIFDLINRTADKQIKSLLAIALLSHKDYLDSLQGESVLGRLTDNDNHTPSRLNALIQQLDFKILTPIMINKLEPEAAISLLCSVTHFHQLTEETVEYLLKKYPYPEVMSYWLNHYSLMPNAHFMLAHLMRSADTHIVTAWALMPKLQQNRIIDLIIKNLPLFKTIPGILYAHDLENNLNLTLEMVLRGRSHHCYVVYLDRLMDRLISKNHQFSDQSTQLWFALNTKPEFIKSMQRHANTMNKHLRDQANEGNISVFYPLHQLRPANLMQPIHLKPLVTAEKKLITTHFLGGFLTTNNNATSTTNSPTSSSMPPFLESPLIKSMVLNNQIVSVFEYFIIYYNGTAKQLAPLLNDYLSIIKNNVGAGEIESIYQLSTLMTNHHLPSYIRETIFKTLLNYPELFDDPICQNLFLYDAKRTIEHFGLQGGAENYEIVISICSGALKKLDHTRDKAIASIASTAKKEAEIELSFTSETGFFQQLLRHFKRCWVTGWTGFFNPNLPKFVAPAPSRFIKTRPELATEPLAVSSNLRSPPDLEELLANINAKLTSAKLKELIVAINNFALSPASPNLFQIRKELDDLYKKLLKLSKNSYPLDKWLKDNQQPFVDNRFHLCELLITSSSAELNPYLIEINAESPHFDKIIQEIKSMIPEQNPMLITPMKSTVPPSLDVDFQNLIVSTATQAAQLVSGVYTLAQGLGSLFAATAAPPAPNVDPGTLSPTATYSPS